MTDEEKQRSLAKGRVPDEASRLNSAGPCAYLSSLQGQAMVEKAKAQGLPLKVWTCGMLGPGLAEHARG